MAKGPTKTVLVVDDDPEIVTMVEMRLVASGFTVITATDGNEAISTARTAMPDAMLLDVMMPGKSGWEVARTIKQDPQTAGIRIVIVSAIGPAVTDATSSLYGADAHVDKPFEFSKLEATLRAVLA